MARGKRIAPEAPVQGGQTGAVEGAGEKAPGYVIDLGKTNVYGPGPLYAVVLSVSNGFPVKEALKEMGYQWHRLLKVWFKFVNVKHLPEELEKLEELGVKPQTGVYEELPDIIHNAMRSAVKRLSRDYGYLMEEAGCCQFMLEPSIYLKRSLEKAANPAKKARLERRIARLLEYLGEFAEVDFDPETMKIVVTYPKPLPTTSQQ